MDELLERVVSVAGNTPDVDEFVASARAVDRAELVVEGDAELRRRTAGEEIHLTVFRDLQRGRGSAELRLLAAAVNPERLVADAAERAASAVGPAWRLPPPSAPTRVTIADADLDADLDAALDTVRGAAIAALQATRRQPSDRNPPTPAPATPASSGPLDLAATRLAIAVERGRTTLRTSRGFAHTYERTLITLDAIVAIAPAGGAAASVEPVHLQGRRVADLAIADAVSGAAWRGRQRRAARPLTAGRHDLALTGEALVTMLPGAAKSTGVDQLVRDETATYGWFGPLVAQADSRVARHGLGRYRPGQTIYGSATPTGDRLTVVSDGTLPFGLFSQPIGDLGEPIRRFSLVDDGRAAAFSLDLREAALRGVASNGGVRNLVVAPGTTPAPALRKPTGRPLVEALDLAWLDIDPLTGTFTARLGLSRVHAVGQPAATARGGVVRGNLFDWLVRARLSSERYTMGWYTGPEAIRFDGVDVS